MKWDASGDHEPSPTDGSEGLPSEARPRTKRCRRVAQIEKKFLELREPGSRFCALADATTAWVFIARKCLDV
jgi:hypothetical protein